MIQEGNKQNALLEIRSQAFELLKSSPEQERKINIEDLGDHCTIQISIRVIRKEFQTRMDRLKFSEF